MFALAGYHIFFSSSAKHRVHLELFYLMFPTRQHRTSNTEAFKTVKRAQIWTLELKITKPQKDDLCDPLEINQ